VRTILRRLQRLEARAYQRPIRFSFLIQFVSGEGKVTGTLLLGPNNERVWTNLEAGQADTALAIQIAHTAEDDSRSWRKERPERSSLFP
jgi:hypothetical protein